MTDQAREGKKLYLSLISIYAYIVIRRNSLKSERLDWGREEGQGAGELCSREPQRSKEISGVGNEGKRSVRCKQLRWLPLVRALCSRLAHVIAN